MTKMLLSTAAKWMRGLRRPRLAATACLIALVWAAVPALGQTIYRVIGPNGEVSYTDTPPKEGRFESFELKPINTQPALDAQPGQETQSQPAASPYTRIEIVAPVTDTVVPPGQLNVVVQLELDPPLLAGHQVQFLLDGQPQGQPAETTAVTLGDLYRGSRTITAHVLDNQSGEVIAQSPGVVIHVKRHSAKH